VRNIQSARPNQVGIAKTKGIPSSFKDVSTHSRATSGGTSIFHASSVNNRDDDDSQISAYKV
jgi:hypothetical protein